MNAARKASLALLLALFAQAALADARVSLGFHFGIPLYWPAPYYYPYYPAPFYYPPPVISYAPSPYAGGWQRVSPIPPPPGP